MQEQDEDEYGDDVEDDDEDVRATSFSQAISMSAGIFCWKKKMGTLESGYFLMVFLCDILQGKGAGGLDDDDDEEEPDEDEDEEEP